MLEKPIVLHQYDAKGKQVKEYKLCIIPWGMMKKVVALSTKLSEDSSTEAAVDAMTKLICEMYRNQFTSQEVEESFEASEVNAALQQMMAACGIANPNLQAGPKE